MKKLNLDQCLENDPNLLRKLSAQNIESIHTDLDLFRSVIDVGQRRASKSVCNWASNIIDCTMAQIYLHILWDRVIPVLARVKSCMMALTGFTSQINIPIGLSSSWKR